MSSDRDITVVIPTIPSRSRMLQRAVGSVARQSRPAAAIVITNDYAGAGASANRNAGIAHVRTPWCAFLDDDDELLPHHLETLLELAEAEGKGIAWGWFDVIGGRDPFPMHRGRPFDVDNPHVVPITYLIRTEVLFAAMVEAGGFRDDVEQTGAWNVQDEPVFVAAARAAGTAVTDRTTWLWHHHARNTSGLASRVTPAAL